MPICSQRIRRAASIMVALTLLLSCGGGDSAGPGNGGGPQVPSDVILSADSLAIQQLAETQLTVTVRDGEGKAIANPAVTWSTSDPSVLTVSTEGLATSPGKAGQASIIAGAGAVSDTVRIRVLPAANSMTMTPDSVNLDQLDSVQLTVHVYDKVGDEILNPVLTFGSFATSVATVSPTGMVTSVGPPGTATISVTSSGLNRQARVKVDQIPTAIVASVDSIPLEYLDSLQVNAHVEDAVGVTMPAEAVTFAIGDPAIATVSPTGLVVSPGAAGSTQLTLASGSLQLQIPVTMEQVPASLALYPQPIVLNQGTIMRLGSRVLDTQGRPIRRAPVSFTPAASGLFTLAASGLLTSSGGTGGGTVSATSNLPTGEMFQASAPVTVVATQVPADTMIGTTALLAPYSGAVTRGGEVYITRLQGGLARAQVNNFTFTTISGTGYEPRSIAVNGTGTRAYVGGYPMSHIGVFDLPSGTLLQSVPVGGYPWHVVLSADEQTIYVGTHQAVVAIDAVNLTIRAQRQLQTSAIHLALHPDGSRLFMAPGAGNVIQELDTGTLELLSSFTVGPTAQGMAFSPDGVHMYIGDSDGGNSLGAVWKFNLQTRAVEKLLPAPCRVFDMVLTPDGSKLYADCPDVGVVRVIDPASLTVVKTIAPGGTPRRLGMSPDGSSIVVPNDNGFVFLIF